MAEIILAVKPSGAGRFDAHLLDRVLIRGSRTPFCDAARALLAQGLAKPSDMLVMRYPVSLTGAVRAGVGVAAGLTVREETADGPPRFVGWKPHPRVREDAPPS